VTSDAARRGALEALDRILSRGTDADDVLRETVAVLGRLYPYAAISFVEEDELVPGPSHGEPSESTRARPIVFHGRKVAELAAAAEAEDDPFLDRVANLVSAHCLVAWDTRGEPWEP
jgi:hypothetical protein